MNPIVTLPQIQQAEIWVRSLQQGIFLQQVLSGAFLILFLDGVGLPGLEFTCRGRKLQRSEGSCAAQTGRQCTAMGMAPRWPGR